MLIKKHRPRMDSYVMEAVKQWLDTGVENWAHADLLAIKIIPVFFELELCTLESFTQWRDSSSKWTRRAAVMCLNSMKKALDAQELLDFVAPLLPDREKVVQQAIGLFLCELWHKAHLPVEDFLLANKDKMDLLALKNATSRMPLAKARLYRKERPHPKPQHPKRNPKYNKKVQPK
jgi:3-methyladenine DNA glycosylase AlkD